MKAKTLRLLIIPVLAFILLPFYQQTNVRAEVPLISKLPLAAALSTAVQTTGQVPAIVGVHLPPLLLSD